MGILDFDKLKDKAKKIGGDIADLGKEAADAVGEKAGELKEKATNVASEAAENAKAKYEEATVSKYIITSEDSGEETDPMTIEEASAYLSEQAEFSITEVK